MKKQLLVLLIVAAALAVFGGTVSALQGRERDIRVKVYVNGEGPVYYETRKITVGEILDEIGVSLSDGCVVEPALEAVAEHDGKIDVQIPIKLNFIIDGAKEPVEYMTLPMSVHGAVTMYGKCVGGGFIYDTSIGLKGAEDGMTIGLTSKIVKEEAVYEEIPYGTIRKETGDLFAGEERIAQRGVNGRGKKLVSVEITGGVETDRDETEWVLEASPVQEIIEFGTKERAPEPAVPPAWGGQTDVSSLKYTKMMDMAATAYTADYASTGKRPGDKYFGICATGMKAQLGVIAVDPRVIPLYTKMYVESYGYAVAGDTGGAIKGRIVDLYFDSPDEVSRFGRQRVNVYILEDQEKEYFALAK
jgi:3D (Asp-Asp-Asp) domain-containing protein/uncharacterized protein YabE (DUF348 family)